MQNGTRICAECESSIEHRTKAAHYCGPRCQKKAEHRRAAERAQVNPPHRVSCSHCGRSIYKAHPSRYPSAFCTHECYTKAKRLAPRRRKPCVDCKQRPSDDHHGRCEVCAWEADWDRRMWRLIAAWLRANDRPRRQRGVRFIAGFCRECGDAFVAVSKLAARYQYCSPQCAKRRANRDGKAKRRARARGTGTHQRVYRARIFERDDWTCQLCGHDVLRDAEPNHPLAPTLDHIIPLARGGTHTPENVWLAHRRCNYLKSDRVPHEFRLAA